MCYILLTNQLLQEVYPSKVYVVRYLSCVKTVSLAAAVVWVLQKGDCLLVQDTAQQPARALSVRVLRQLCGVHVGWESMAPLLKLPSLSIYRY